MTWRIESSKIKSKGSIYKALGKVKNLSDLHEARSEHDSQFFTPTSISCLVFQLLDVISEKAYAQGIRVPVLDNTIGSGSLIEYANPSRYSIYGNDIDRECVDALSQDLRAAGFIHKLTNSNLAELRTSGMGVALLNPPFSVQLSSAALEPGKSTHFGRFGANTNAVSHEYALEQALRASQCVIAILPTTFAQSLKHGRLMEIVDLPNDTFRSENANVRTSLAIFGARYSETIISTKFHDFCIRKTAERIGQLQVDDLEPHIYNYRIDDSRKAIRTPVTSDNRVRIFRSKNQIKLKFYCGFTEAKVLNGILRDFIESKASQRLPEHLEYKGQGRLYLPFYFASEDPIAELFVLSDLIKSLGGEPQICDQLVGFIKRRFRQLTIQNSGYARLIKSSDPVSKKAEVKKSFVIDPTIFPATIVKKGEQIKLLSTEGVEWSFLRENDEKCVCLKERLEANCDIVASPLQWNRIGKSMAERMPQKAEIIKARCIESRAFEFSSWTYQKHDLVEALLSPRGSIIGFQQGLGKTRFAYSLAAASHSSRSLIVTLPSLKLDFIEAAIDLGLKVNVIDSVDDAAELGEINLITVTRLRCQFGHTRQTFSKALRNRFGTVILDEADLLRNTNTEQSRSILQLGGVRRYALTGTPISNYPRNIIGIARWVFGDGNLINPYSTKKAYPEAYALKTCDFTRRGLDVFNEQFVTLQWATHEFREDHQKGAKREIPTIKNLNAYRKYLSKLIIRRVRDEPDVAPYFPKIKIEEVTHTVKWNNAHLLSYLQVAEEFKAWFDRQVAEGNKNSLVAILARIGAVIAAANNPCFPTKHSKGYYQTNTKEQKLFELLKTEKAKKRKVIVFLDSPSQATRLQRLCESANIQSIVLSGEVSAKIRHSELNQKFKTSDEFGVCFATFGVAKYGLNIPEAETIIMYHRCWSYSDESQAFFRVLRPQQIKDVTIHYLHLEGSIDEYMAQMVAFKRDAANSGLDYAEPSKNLSDFQHFDHIFYKFCSHLCKLYNVETRGRLIEILAS